MPISKRESLHAFAEARNAGPRDELISRIDKAIESMGEGETIKIPISPGTPDFVVFEVSAIYIGLDWKCDSQYDLSEGGYISLT